MKAADLKCIEEWAGDLDGVFTMPDLKVLFGKQSAAALYKKLRAFVAEGVLVKVKRGLYARPAASLEVISSRICRDSYISTGTILARSRAIGSVPARRVQAVKVGHPRAYVCELGMIEHLSIEPRLYFGFTADGVVKYATAEKAYLDACYFSYKGRRFSFDLDTDIDTDALDARLILEYLTKYDRRFATYFRRNCGHG